MKQDEFHIINGKTLAEELLNDLRHKIAATTRRPGLAVIVIGNNPSSALYVKNKEKASHKVGIEFHKYLCNDECFKDISENKIIEMIQFLNKDPNISGIIVQLPLPEKYNTQKIINAIDPKKDADGFHPENIKKILSENSKNYPPLIQTIFHILKSIKIDLAKKKVLILSKSNVFQTVIVKALRDQDAEVQVLTLDEKEAKEKLQRADIAISILGKPKTIRGDMIKEGAVLIDVGITQTSEGFQGDIDFESIKKVASCATPTPGGVGPITVAMLLKNVFELCQKQHQ